jgi:hypothetical protein
VFFRHGGNVVCHTWSKSNKGAERVVNFIQINFLLTSGAVDVVTNASSQTKPN